MTENERMKCLTVGAWLKGYAKALEEDAKDERHNALIHNMITASYLLEKVWDEQMHEIKVGGTD